MKIQLELEDFRFATTGAPIIGKVRWLQCKVGERVFTTFKTITDDVPWWTSRHEEAMDRELIKMMEAMLAKVLVESCEAVKPGTVLSTDPIQGIL